MESRETKQNAFASFRQLDEYDANTRFGSLALDETHFCQSIHELNGRVRFEQKFLGQLSYRNGAMRLRLDKEDRLVLLSRHALLAGGFFAEDEKSSERASKARERSDLFLVDVHQLNRYHEPNSPRRLEPCRRG